MILDANGNALDPLWCAEFNGFFIGEGNLEIGQYSRIYRGKRMLYLRPRARLIQRDDNRLILEAICSKLGGHITGHNSQRITSPTNNKLYVSHPTIVWQTVSKEGVQRVLDILRLGIFPHLKYREIDILQRYLNIMPSPGIKYTEPLREQVWALKAELETLRQYSEC